MAIDFWNRLTFFNTLEPLDPRTYRQDDLRAFERCLETERQRLTRAFDRARDAMTDYEQRRRS